MAERMQTQGTEVAGQGTRDGDNAQEVRGEKRGMRRIDL